MDARTAGPVVLLRRLAWTPTGDRSWLRSGAADPPNL